MKRESRNALRLLLAVIAVVVIAGVGMIRMPGKSFRGSLPDLDEAGRQLGDQLRAHVEHLGASIGERNVAKPRGLANAAEYIRQALIAGGCAVSNQTYEVSGVRCSNIEGSVPGHARPDEIVVVGAHYDSVHGSPGANDNGSGVAATLALARRFAARPAARTLRFVTFVNEEPPYFQTEEMGSLVYARSCRARADRIVAMLSLETMGFYSDEPNSQRYPFPLGLFYPSRGNFIGFVSNWSNRRILHRALAAFREHAQFPSEGAAPPGWVPGVGWSDHWSFWKAGYPALMVTDTALFRYVPYHTPGDTPDRLDYDRFARVVEGLVPVIENFANGP